MSFIVTIVVALIVAPYTKLVAVADTVTTVSEKQADYVWRQPWEVARNAAQSRAGNVVGDFSSNMTTYLPGTNKYSVPVQARGLITGYSEVVEYSLDKDTSTSCAFDNQVPVPLGLFEYNLRRSLSFVAVNLTYNEEDIWAYCDKEKAKLVVPVVTFQGQPQGHPVPAGVVIFDGNTINWQHNVAPGELPGPVYPMSVSQAQLESTTTTSGLADYLLGTTGYTSTQGDGDVNQVNATNLLLDRADKSGYDFVTPLSPRGKSSSVVAVATVAANSVSYGVVNPMTVHTLATPREGTGAVNDRIKSAFPDLGWATGLKLSEVVPLSDTTWVATLANERSIAGRVRLTGNEVCLDNASGQQVKCIDAEGVAQGGTGITNPGPANVPSSDVSTLTDEQLADLATEVARETSRRLKK